MRQVALDNWIWTIALSEQNKRDFLDGKCTLSVYENVPIVDYTRPWGSIEPIAYMDPN